MHVSGHPLVAHKLTLLRQVETEAKQFDELVGELGWLMGYEALADLPLRPAPIRTPLEPAEGAELADRIGLVPILRAGLGLVGGFRQLIPQAQVWHLGLYQDEATRRPVEYYNRLPERSAVQVCFVLDPMLATGGSAVRAIEILKGWGAGRIKFVGLIAAPYGVQQLVRRFPDVDIHVAALDRELNDHGYILPGLGDAGDRQFGTGLA
ncbi:MAG TPA: uracil phosphoribosyltransferase [Dehalococcoidia bacterium]|nr:uracil phosphoribosyltransferase [Dehalococcoidia bacterium]